MKTEATYSRKLCLVSLLLALVLILGLAAAAPAYEGPVGTAQMLVNKDYLLYSDQVPGDLVKVSDYMPAVSNQQLCRVAATALQRANNDMKAANIRGLYGQSGYRSYSIQSGLFQRKISYYKGLGYGQADAERLGGQVVAPPGASEHQTGLAIDVTAGGTGLTESFGSTAEGKWLSAHSWEYGFILRYPKDRTTDTGYIFEPWHFRYVGLPHSEYIQKNNLILEDYIQRLKTQGAIGITSSLDNQTYVVYYCNTLAEIDTLPGQIISVSYATAKRDSYIVTTLPDEGVLYDLIGHWAQENVRHLVQLNIVTGYTDYTFKPNRDISRAELIALIARTYRLLFDPQEEPPLAMPYVDVREQDYFHGSLWLCYSKGLLPASMLAQEGSLFFSPDQRALRWEAAQSLSPLFAALPTVPNSDRVFLDMLDASPELQKSVALLSDYGIVQGDNYGNFNPYATITRAEICAMLDRITQYFYGQSALALIDPSAAQPEATETTDATETEEDTPIRGKVLVNK